MKLEVLTQGVRGPKPRPGHAANIVAKYSCRPLPADKNADQQENTAYIHEAEVCFDHGSAPFKALDSSVIAMVK